MKSVKTIPAVIAMLIICFLLITPPGFAQDKPKLSDAEVANVAVTANQIDIDYAAIAKKKSKTESVLQFAATMASDHKGVIDKAVALVTKLNVTPQDNAVSKQLLTDAAKTKKKLNALSGEAFDKAYIDNEVAYHKAVIAAIEGLLIPESENAELKELLQSVVPAFKAHLKHAEMVQSMHAGK